MEDTSSTPNQKPGPIQLVPDSTKAPTEKDGPGPVTLPKTTKTQGKPGKTLNDSMTTSKRVPDMPLKGPGSGLERERYESICLDLMEGMTLLEARRKHGTGQAVVAAIRRHLGELVPSVDEMAAQGFEAVRDLALKAMFDKIASGEGKLGELSVAAGVSADKLDMIRGRSQPSQVHQHLHISHTSVQDLMAALPTKDTQSPVSSPKTPDIVDIEDSGSQISANPGE